MSTTGNGADYFSLFLVTNYGRVVQCDSDKPWRSLRYSPHQQ
jgi:hypothetical protein